MRTSSKPKRTESGTSGSARLPGSVDQRLSFLWGILKGWVQTQRNQEPPNDVFWVLFVFLALSIRTDPFFVPFFDTPRKCVAPKKGAQGAIPRQVPARSRAEAPRLCRIMGSERLKSEKLWLNPLELQARKVELTHFARNEGLPEYQRGCFGWTRNGGRARVPFGAHLEKPTKQRAANMYELQTRRAQIEMRTPVSCRCFPLSHSQAKATKATKSVSHTDPGA